MIDPTASMPPITRRNPLWNRDETILALQLLIRRRPTLPGQNDPEIVALSRLLNAYSAKMGLAGDDRMRNANGVSMKVANLSRLDPNDPRKGLSHGARIEAEVWHEFATDPHRLALVAEAIRSAISAPEIVDSTPEPDYGADGEAMEGRILARFHVYRERDRDIVQRKKKRMLGAEGRLSCECCGFDFHLFYGERGEGFAEVHHTRPLHLIEFGTPTRIDDLAIVCANCHRMIHTRRPWLTVLGLRNVVQSRRDGSRAVP